MSSPVMGERRQASLLSPADSKALDVLEWAANIRIPGGIVAPEDAEAVVVVRPGYYGWYVLSALHRPPLGSARGAATYEWVGARFGLLSSGKALTFRGQAEFGVDEDGVRRVTWGIPTLHDGVGPTPEDRQVLSRFLGADAEILRSGRAAVPPEMHNMVGDVVGARPFVDPVLRVAAASAVLECLAR